MLGAEILRPTNAIGNIAVSHWRSSLLVSIGTNAIIVPIRKTTLKWRELAFILAKIIVFGRLFRTECTKIEPMVFLLHHKRALAILLELFWESMVGTAMWR